MARIGGDEFMIIQTGPVVASSIRTLARRIIETVALPIDLDGQACVVGTSVGVAIAPQDGMDPDQLCRNADLALFEPRMPGATLPLYDRACDSWRRGRTGNDAEKRRHPPPNHPRRQRPLGALGFAYQPCVSAPVGRRP